MTKTPVPPHYAAFRVVLVIVIAAALAGAGWWFVEAGTFDAVLDSIGLRP